MSDWVTSGPNDFVSGPYLPCPRCHEPRLGVLSIGPHLVIRRCTTCQAKVRQELPQLNKRILYLDQSAVSNMMLALHPNARRTSPHVRFWRTLFFKLDRLVRMQLIACPYTSTHMNESMVAPQIEADLLRMARHFSADVRFADRHDIELHQLLHSARAWLRGEPIQLPPSSAHFALEGDPTAWTNKLTFAINVHWSRECVDSVRSVRDGTQTGLEAVFERWRTEQMSFEARFREEAMGLGRAKLDAQRRHVQRMADIRAGRVQATADDGVPCSGSAVFRIFETFVGEGLDYETATGRAVEFFGSDALLAVPFNRLSAMLWASLAREAQSGRRRPPDRGTAGDFAAISTSLPYCHLMFVDNKCAEYLSCRPLLDEVARYRCIVCSLRTGSELIARLEEIEVQASDQHRALVAQIYGPMPPTS